VLLTKDHAASRRRKLMDNAVRSLRNAIERLSGLPSGALGAEALRSAGWMLKDLERTSDAEDALKQALRTFEQLGNARQIAWTKRDLGCLYRDTGQLELSATLLKESEQVFRELGDRRQLAVSLKDLGVLALREQGSTLPDMAAKGDTYFLEALELACVFGEEDLAAWLLRYRGLAEALQGRGEAARDLIAQSRQRFLHFREANQALCDYLLAHLGTVRHAYLLELLGHAPSAANAVYSGLLK
jgi:hypothetical protein